MNNNDIFLTVKKNYPIHKYILDENESQPPQANLINIAIEKTENLEDIVNSYLTYHKTHFHLKNYLMKLRKKQFGYRQEFIDIFYDIFLDNFLILKELSRYFKEDHSKYTNIWLDCFFINIFNKIIDDSSRKYHNIQPNLFFVVLLFVTLPEISKDFIEVPFSSLIKFHESTEDDWKKAIFILKEIKFKEPNNIKTIEKVRSFLHIFMGLNTQIDKKNEIIFDETSKQQCVYFIESLINKTEDMIANIKKIRKNLLINPVA